jgi:adenosylmethionine---8-amino-7-oxononanoate aminotransferase
MVNVEDFLNMDARHVWPPCTALNTLNPIPRLIVERAEGSYLYTHQGPVIDAVSSWWCKTLGHGPKPVLEAIQAQLGQFEHVIGANTTYPALVNLAKQLEKITGLSRVFFASDGSCAVEIALKLALHAMQLRGEPERRQWLALSNGYHGETIATLSVSDVSCYKQPFEGLGLACHMIQDVPYVSGEDDPMWHDCEAMWPQVEAQLEAYKHTACGVLVEPILQGAGGMRVYSADFLRRLRNWASQNGCYFVADEIMTGLGRTGEWLASDHAGIKPDLVCLSKSLTAGTMPLSCVLIHDDVYDLFYQHPEHPFLHSHTYTGHALGVAAACATLDIMQADDINARAVLLGKKMKARFQAVADATGRLENIRSIGGLVAGDLITPDDATNWGRKFAHETLKRGALLRPLDKTVYWMPPLTTDIATLDALAEITCDAIHTLD